ENRSVVICAATSSCSVEASFAVLNQASGLIPILAFSFAKLVVENRVSLRLGRNHRKSYKRKLNREPQRKTYGSQAPFREVSTLHALRHTFTSQRQIWSTRGPPRWRPLHSTCIA